MKVYKGRLLKKSSDWKSKLILSNVTLVTSNYMAFLFRTDLAASFGCYRFRITPDIVSKLLRTAIWSLCAVQFESEQTSFPRTGRRLWPAALHRIQIGTCGFVPKITSYVICLLRDQWLIERLSEAMGAALVSNNFSPISSKFSFHMKKTKIYRCPISTTI